LRVLQVPLLVEQRIIGRGERVPPLVDFCVLDLRIGAQPREGLRAALPGMWADAQQVDPGNDVACLSDRESMARGQRHDAPRCRLVRRRLGCRTQPDDDALYAHSRRRRGRGCHGRPLGKRRHQHYAKPVQTHR